MAELIIDDGNFVNFINPTVDGEVKICCAVPRDYSQVPHGSRGYCLPSTVKRIPRSEWSARIKEMEQTKSRLSDIWKAQGVKVLDQNGTNFCHDDKTEVLTERGWTMWSDYNGSDLLGTMNQSTGLLEFQPCLQKHVYEYNGELIHSTNRCIDFGVTPDHRMLVRKWNERQRTLSPSYSFERAGSLGWYFGLPPCTSGHIGTDLVEVSIEGDRAYDGDDFVEMLSLIASDGWAGGVEKTKNAVSFVCFSEDRYHAVAALAHRLGFKEQPSRRGVWIRWNAGALANWVRANCYTSPELGSSKKKIPDIIKAASSRQIKRFLSIFGDQSHNSRQTEFFSTSKRLIDDLQELLLRIGKRGSIWKGDVYPPSVFPNGQVATPRHPIWHLHCRATHRLSIDKKKQIEQDRYRGQVYCATVPNGTLVTRRNGSILISGNCWTNGVVSAMYAVRAISNEPFVELSPASVAAPIKNFRNQGGWAGEALEWIVKKGVCRSSLWPVNAIDRQYYTDEAKADALLHRIQEWDDLPAGDFDMQMTYAFMRIPVPVGFNHWQHEVCQLDPVEIEKGSYGIRIVNSWGASWSEGGMAVMTESKGTADDAIAPRVTMAF